MVVGGSLSKKSSWARLLSNGRPVAMAWGAQVTSAGDLSFVQGAQNVFKYETYLVKSFPARDGNAAVRLVPMTSAFWLFVKEISFTFPAVIIRLNSAGLGTAINLLSKRTKVLERVRVAWLMLRVLPGKLYKIAWQTTRGRTIHTKEKSVFDTGLRSMSEIVENWCQLISTLNAFVIGAAGYKGGNYKGLFSQVSAW